MKNQIIQRCAGCVVNYTSNNLCDLCQSIERHKFAGNDYPASARRVLIRILALAGVLTFAYLVALPRIIELAR